MFSSPLNMSWLRAAVITTLLCLSVGFADARTKHQDFSGQVVGVSDGDTITVLVKKVPIKVRLYGIDAPEKKQAFGMRAKKFTSQLVFKKNVTVKVKAKDRYGRIVGIVLLPDGRKLNEEVVRAGFAWWYKQYAPKDETLKLLEIQARAEKKEIWSDPKAIPPWNFRRQKKGPIAFGDRPQSTICQSTISSDHTRACLNPSTYQTSWLDWLRELS